MLTIIDRLERVEGPDNEVVTTRQVGKGDTPLKITPASADTFMLFDSADGAKPKLVTKADLVANLQGPVGPPGIGGGYVFCSGVECEGNTGNFVLDPTSIDPFTVIESCYVDNANVTVHFIAEGGHTFAPVVTVGGVECTNLEVMPNSVRLFTGSVQLTITEDTLVPVVSDTGRSFQFHIFRAASGPTLSAVSITGLPSGQTDVKAGDLITVTGTKSAIESEIRFVGGDACDSSGWISAPAGTTFSVQGTVSNLTGPQTVTLEARSLFGTVGPQAVSDAVTLDQGVPTFSGYSVVNTSTGLPAFKGSEVGTFDLTITGATGVTYSNPGNEFNITNPSLYEPTKTITCLNPGTYNESTTNISILAVKATNGTQATYDINIPVADLAPVITVTQPQTRLRSGGNDGTQAQEYVITATSTQNLLSAPSINVGVSGTWLGSFTGSNTTWQATLQVHDNDLKGTGAWTFNTTPTNRAGIPAVATIAGDPQCNEGFVSRDIVLTVYTYEAAMNVDVVDYNNVTMTWRNPNDGYNIIKALPNQRPVGTTGLYDQGSWCLHTLSPNPNIIRILDTSAINAFTDDNNSIMRIEET